MSTPVYLRPLPRGEGFTSRRRPGTRASLPLGSHAALSILYSDLWQEEGSKVDKDDLGKCQEEPNILRSFRMMRNHDKVLMMCLFHVFMNKIANF